MPYIDGKRVSLAMWRAVQAKAKADAEAAAAIPEADQPVVTRAGKASARSNTKAKAAAAAVKAATGVSLDALPDGIGPKAEIVEADDNEDASEPDQALAATDSDGDADDSVETQDVTETEEAE